MQTSLSIKFTVTLLALLAVGAAQTTLVSAVPASKPRHSSGRVHAFVKREPRFRFRRRPPMRKAPVVRDPHVPSGTPKSVNPSVPSGTPQALNPNVVPGSLQAANPNVVPSMPRDYSMPLTIGSTVVGLGSTGAMIGVTAHQNKVAKDQSGNQDYYDPYTDYPYYDPYQQYYYQQQPVQQQPVQQQQVQQPSGAHDANLQMHW